MQRSRIFYLLFPPPFFFFCKSRVTRNDCDSQTYYMLLHSSSTLLSTVTTWDFSSYGFLLILSGIVTFSTWLPFSSLLPLYSHGQSCWSNKMSSWSLSVQIFALDQSLTSKHWHIAGRKGGDALRGLTCCLEPSHSLTLRLCC